MISFIIPAFNEAGVIGNTITAIKENCLIPEKEIIVVDNGSTDTTMQEAKALGANVVSFNGGTIAAVRNFGVSKSCGNILIFIDADVVLTSKWQLNIDAQIKALESAPMQVTGSRCHPPENGNWFNEHWYKHMVHQPTNYINSGHLITTRLVFEKVSGFTENLKTAEDYDFCEKAIKANCSINPNLDLVTIHDGYPKTFKHFVQRERWHGREDYESLSSTFKSKVALVAIFNLSLFLIAIIYSIYESSAVNFIYYVAPMLTVCIALTAIKFKRVSVSVISHSSMIHFFYIWGRSLALLDRILGKKINRFREQG